MAVNDDAPSRTPLDRALILRAAIEVADERGLEALSMRSLAGRLGVTAMSLYNHVANKDEILGGMIDAVFDEIELPAGAEWKAAIRTSSLSAREALVRHPWASELLTSALSPGPARLRHSDWQLRTLRAGGLSDELVFHAFHVLESQLLGSTVQQLNLPVPGEELAAMAANYLEAFPVEEYPDMGEHIRQHVDPDRHRTRTGFEFALDLILDGLEHARDAEGSG
ncbi:MAG TPA: TetR/AcrR family transcriptional regulator [Egicoccus sp.]|nr:TetR/AcrR family transcriptional regulator [Egicoccus sp.]HSK23822.1 TetR/AcrR family transcriptional regulator [Egicoccus sp.]